MPTLPARFTNEDAARNHLENKLWPDGPICPFCGVVDGSSRITTRKGLWFCNSCRKQFTVTVGTVMESSHIPLHTWLYANHLLCCSKKGISSHQLSRMLGVSYKSAWFLSHRIREAWTPLAEPPLGGEGSVVEADETELAPSRKTRSRPRAKNMKFISLVERDGRVRSRKLTGAKGQIGHEIRAALSANVDDASTLHTDLGSPYKTSWMLDRHWFVDHSREFKSVDGAHINTAEGYFSIFKRGLVGTYQHMSEQHLQRYLAEFDFRMSYRARLGYDDAMRADIALKGITGKRLTYRRINKAADAETASSSVPPLA